MAIAFVSAAARDNASGDCVLDAPATINDNDVLVAMLNTRGTTVTAAPSGWTQQASELTESNPKAYFYYKVVTDAASEPSTYTWTLAASSTNGGVIAGYSGVDNSTPMDVAASSASSGAAPTSLAIPSITTATDNAWLVAGWMLNSGSVTINEDAAMTERGETSSGNARVNEADEDAGAAGASGTRTGDWSSGRNCAGIMGALRPDAGAPPQTARPDGDVSLDGWTDDGGGTTNIYQSIDEVTASDSDFVRSPEGPTSDVYEFTLESLSHPQVNTGHIVRYRYHKNTAGGDQVNLIVGLYQGATLIASQTHNNISDGVTAGSFTLSGAEADNIDDYHDLRIRLTANTP